MNSDWKPSNAFGANIMAGRLKLDPDFSAFIKSLNKHDVHYLIVGGYAVAFHGHPRYTKDLDVWLERDSANAVKVIQALDEFGFGSLGLKSSDFLTPGQVIQLGRPPNRIDLLTSASGVEFNECYATRVMATVDGVSVSVIDLEHLKRNKQASGRTQDLADLENLG